MHPDNQLAVIAEHLAATHRRADAARMVARADGRSRRRLRGRRRAPVPANRGPDG